MGALLPLSRLVLGHMSAQGPLGVCENRVLCGGKCSVGVGMGISDATSCNQLVPTPCLTDERESRFGAAVVAPKTTVFLANGESIEPVWQLARS